MSFVCDFRHGDRVLFFGDSKTQQNPGDPNSVKWHWVLGRRIRAKCAQLGIDVSFISSGLAGDTVASAFGAASTRVYKWAPTGIIIALGTNDASSLTVNATFQTNVINCLTGLQTAANYPNKTAPRWIAWIGVNAIGEKHPDGANAFDVVANGINDHSDILFTQCGAHGVLYWDPREAVVNWETFYNPGNAGSGFLMSTLDGAGGKHEVQLGAQTMSDWIMDGVSGGISAVLPQFPFFTFVKP